MSVRFVIRMAFLVLACVPVAARAQQVAYAASVAPELDSVTQAAVTRDVALARERGLPVDPLLAKVREGRLKRAPGASIRSAVAKLMTRLDSARAALGGQSSNEELVAGADAIAVGAGVSSLRAIRAASSKPVTGPLGTLAQLVASGVSPGKATEMILSLIRKNATPSQVLALGNLVERDVASGLNPDDAAAIRLRGIEMTSIGFGDKVNIVQPAATGDPTGASKPPSTPPPKRRP